MKLSVATNANLPRVSAPRAIAATASVTPATPPIIVSGDVALFLVPAQTVSTAQFKVVG